MLNRTNKKECLYSSKRPPGLDGMMCAESTTRRQEKGSNSSRQTGTSSSERYMACLQLVQSAQQSSISLILSAVSCSWRAYMGISERHKSTNA